MPDSDASRMPRSTPAELLPDGGSLRSRHSGSATFGAIAAQSASVCESLAEPSLLREVGHAFAAVGDSVEERGRSGGQDLRAADAGFDADGEAAVGEIVAQLAPIRTEAALRSSYAREANPADERVRTAYARAWMSLVMGGARSTTRRARIRATMAQPRGAR